MGDADAGAVVGALGVAKAADSGGNRCGDHRGDGDGKGLEGNIAVVQYVLLSLFDMTRVTLCSYGQANYACTLNCPSAYSGYVMNSGRHTVSTKRS